MYQLPILHAFKTCCPALIPPDRFHRIFREEFQAIVETTTEESLSSDKLLVSFDVSSLFTNVPIQKAVDVICRRLQDDKRLCERTAMQPISIAGLLELCIRSTYFSFGGQIYEQKEGLQWVPRYRLL